jgi:signal transduction histidine kinase
VLCVVLAVPCVLAIAGMESVALAAIGVAVGALAAIYAMRSHYRSETQICNKLKTITNGLESDFAQLQVDDDAGQLASAWNRLVETTAEARRELETFQVKQDIAETLSRYQFDWINELLDRLPVGLLTVDGALKIGFANTAATRMLGRTREALLGQDVVALFDESIAYVRPPSAASLDRVYDLSDPEASLHVTSAPWGIDGNQETALFLRDVSQEKEDALARDQFLYHITHELRTPLTNIRAYAETLSEGVFQDPDTLRECYNVIVGETHRLSRLVEDILSLSQLEVGSARLNMTDVQTARLIRQVVEDMQAAADDKNVELVLSLPPKVPTVRGDKERLAVVLTNLIGNAIKYTPAGGRVEVSCVEDGARLQIAVADTGIGIAPEDQAHVFDKFYRAKNEQVEHLVGTGLGLAIANETIRAHGGIIELESEPGKGSTFRAILPIGKTAGIGEEVG